MKHIFLNIHRGALPRKYRNWLILKLNASGQQTRLDFQRQTLENERKYKEQFEQNQRRQREREKKKNEEFEQLRVQREQSRLEWKRKIKKETQWLKLSYKFLVNHEDKPVNRLFPALYPISRRHKV